MCYVKGEHVCGGEGWGVGGGACVGGEGGVQEGACLRRFFHFFLQKYQCDLLLANFSCVGVKGEGRGGEGLPH